MNTAYETINVSLFDTGNDIFNDNLFKTVNIPKNDKVIIETVYVYFANINNKSMTRNFSSYIKYNLSLLLYINGCLFIKEPFCKIQYNKGLYEYKYTLSHKLSITSDDITIFKIENSTNNEINKEYINHKVIAVLAGKYIRYVNVKTDNEYTANE